MVRSMLLSITFISTQPVLSSLKWLRWRLLTHHYILLKLRMREVMFLDLRYDFMKSPWTQGVADYILLTCIENIDIKDIAPCLQASGAV